MANEKTAFTDAFALADQVALFGVACISDLIVKEGPINLDFADVLSIMREKGRAMMAEPRLNDPRSEPEASLSTLGSHPQPVRGAAARPRQGLSRARRRGVRGLLAGP